MIFWRRTGHFKRLFSARCLSSAALAAALIAGGGCHTTALVRPGEFEARKGDEIVVAGNFVHTGTPVVLWMDPGGYDGYRAERRFSPYEKSSWSNSTAEARELVRPARYRTRDADLSPEELERVRGGGWDLPLLQRTVDQFVVHFDVAGVSRNCFKTLHDSRDLSVHFMLDIDGTIYQTLDLKECAQHATKANDRSVGIEIANLGAYSHSNTTQLDKWYTQKNGQTTIVVPASLVNTVRTKGFVGHPRRPDLIKGKIHGEELVQYDFTPQQYAALVKLTATLCTILPKIQCRYPTDADGKLIAGKLPNAVYDNYQGVLGHYHVQRDKVDPGPAFDWDYVIGGARKLMDNPLKEANTRNDSASIIP